MLIDFHTHSNASDGALPPLELVRRAKDLGVQALAITDHDTLAGWREVSKSPVEGITLIPGVELSCQWGGATIHVVGLGVDGDDPELAALLLQLDRLRRDRAAKIAAKLAKLGMPGAIEGAQELAGDGPICRPHFAHWLVSQGYVEPVGKAFDKWLGDGKPGDIKTQWPQLDESVSAITRSGGVATLAHPLKYRFTRSKLRALCSDFMTAGGSGIEIVNGRQGAADISNLKRLSQEMGLAVSVGSDFHRDWIYGAELGVETDIADGLPTVWQVLL